jgi:sucrose phosphorylase
VKTHDPSEKISYQLTNATFYSALGEDDQKMLVARAIQMFMLSAHRKYGI